MSRTFRDLYGKTVKGAIPVGEKENFLFQLANLEEGAETLEKFNSLAHQIVNQKPQGGAPRKTAGDGMLAAELMTKHNGAVKLARLEFISIVADRDQIEKKRARERFNAALKSLKT
jgi:hypothetical protein